MTTENERALTLDLGATLAPPLSARHGLRRNEIRQEARRLRRVLERLVSSDAPSGFAKLPRRRAALDATLRMARQVRRRNWHDWVHVGIGGSSLGAEAIYCALADPMHNRRAGRGTAAGPRIHFVDNVDPVRVEALLASLDLRRTGFHIVSKSGSTLETVAILDRIQGAYARSRKGPWSEHCVFTTGRGPLAGLARAEGVPRLRFPEDVGGRFSALTPSGLLTPAVAGVDVRRVMSGARSYLRSQLGHTIVQCAPALAAAAAYQLAESRKKPIHVFMPYGDGLDAFSRWAVQLFAESLGKYSTRLRRSVGPTPLPARGTTDQHAQVQLFVEGPADKWINFVGWGREGEGPKLSGNGPASFLAGASLGQVLDASRLGTEIALARADRPSCTWSLTGSPESLGAFLLALELQVAFEAHLYGVDAYDQPGVEAGKVAASALLGRAGFEGERKVIDASATPHWVI